MNDTTPILIQLHLLPHELLMLERIQASWEATQSDHGSPMTPERILITLARLGIRQECERIQALNLERGSVHPAPRAEEVAA